MFTSFAAGMPPGLDFDVNLTKPFEHEADGRPTGEWFGHSGFNSGYLTLAVASKTGGKGGSSWPISRQRTCPATSPKWPFIMRVVKRIAEAEGW
jgi:hypothetical protein